MGYDGALIGTSLLKAPAGIESILREFEQRAANSNFRPESFDQAARWYKEAIALDPNFALAISQLAICQLRRHWLTDPLSEAELMETGRLAKQALTLAPDLPEAHVAMGVFHYYGFREYEPALTEFQRAIERQPNNSETLQFIGAVHRRQGRWNATLDELKRSLDQDPRDANIASAIAETHFLLRSWKAAEEMAGHSLAIDPHGALGMRVLLLSSLNRTGSAEDPDSLSRPRRHPPPPARCTSAAAASQDWIRRW